MKKSAVALFGLAMDVMCKGVPVGSAGALLLTEILTKRKDKAEQIAMEELRRGLTIPAGLDEDSFVTKAQSYTKHAMEGVARLNLRLLAKVLASEFRDGPPVRADEFLHYAAIISSFRSEEVVLLGSLLRNRTKVRSSESPGARKDDLAIYQAAQQELCFRYFGSQDEMWATAAGLQRTGFLVHNGGTSGGTWLLTVLADKFEQVAQMECALSTEAIFPYSEKRVAPSEL